MFEKLKYFNHTDTMNRVTENSKFPSLDNEFWQRHPDRIRAYSPTKGIGLKTTSKNTVYGRSETREWDPINNIKAAAFIDEFPWNYVAVRQALVDLGPQGKLISLQWHGDSTRPLSKCQWYLNKDKKTCRLNWQVAPRYKGDEVEVILVDNVPLGQVFDLALAWNKDKIVAYYNWGKSDVKTMEQPISYLSYRQDTGLYCKFGVYCQTNITNTKTVDGVKVPDQKEGQGVVDIFEFDVYHGEVCDLPNFDKTAFWRVGEDSSAEERTRAPGWDLSGVQGEHQAAVQKLMSQIEGNLSRGAKTTARNNLEILEEILDDVTGDVSELRDWITVQRNKLK